jgi:vancomycin permeability regulator SanA
MLKTKPAGRRLRVLLISLGLAAAVLLVGVLIVDAGVTRLGRRLIVGQTDLDRVDCVIVPGALVYADRPSQMLQDRLDVALEIYRAGYTNRILVSGDHGRTDYDEVNIMRDYLLGLGVPPEHIFMDHAGFDTYDTLFRARDVFLVRTAILVTQEFHLIRALYIGEQLGLEVTGVSSDRHDYGKARYYRLREYLARCKAFLDCRVFHARPTYLGETIPISGSGLATVD